jgi:hypothetical protein
MNFRFYILKLIFFYIVMSLYLFLFLTADRKAAEKMSQYDRYFFLLVYELSVFSKRSRLLDEYTYNLFNINYNQWHCELSKRWTNRFRVLNKYIYESLCFFLSFYSHIFTMFLCEEFNFC